MGTQVSSIPKQSFDASALVSGSIDDARIPAAIARDIELTGAIEGTLADFQANVATGTFPTVAPVNDNNVAAGGQASAIDQYAEIDYGKIVSVNRFRYYGNVAHNADGEWKLQYYNLATHAWTDWVTGIPTRATADWSTWDISGGEIITNKIRLVCVAVDTGPAGFSWMMELEVIYA